MTRARRWTAVLQCSTALLSLAAAACGSAAGDVCTRDDECPSGFCKADGTCGAAGPDAGAAGDGGEHDAPTSELCAPDHDGLVERAELPLVAGRMARFRVATDAAFDSAGVANGDGSRRWDLAGTLAGDMDQPTALVSPAGTWWEPLFPAATYATTLSVESDLLGVFVADDSALALVGVVSPEAGASRTELEYDPPVQVLALPIRAGGTWTSTSTVSGVALGYVTAYTERYQSRVDEVGTMTTPYGEFPVVRIATDLRRTQGGALLLTKRSFGWVAECFGTVATVTSQDFEPDSEFADPAEVRRLAP